MKRLRKKPIRRITGQEKPANSLWKGPLEDGITFSLLSKFCVCRERFRLQVVEGLKEDDGFNHALEFGSLWHEAEEAHSGGKDWRPAMRKYRDRLRANYSEAESEINKWFNIAKTQFPLYVDHWKENPDEQRRKPILEEEAFRVSYQLPSGRTITLRGKFDCVFRIGKSSVYLQENKTKGHVDEQGIQATVNQNLQTMLYQIALRTIHASPNKPAWAKKLAGCQIKGVLYNVVRRPLSDRSKHCIRQRVKETPSQFYKRLGTVIRDNSNYFFHRWKVLLTKQDIETFKARVFHPLLEQLCDWWEWITGGGINAPWSPHLETGIPGGGVHWQAPWGVYNSLAGGFRGDYFTLLASGKRASLKRINNLFPELTS